MLEATLDIPLELERVDVLYAFLSGKDGKEGVMSMDIPGLGHVPCIFSLVRVAEMVKPVMARSAAATGHTIKLVKFVRGEVLETIEP
jgi:hypothetical protein